VAKRQGNNLRRYAVVGAEQRLLELAKEAAGIFAMFPELRAPGRGFMSGGLAGKTGQAAAAAGAAVPRRRRKMSAEARKRISDAQKARWARQRAAGGSKKK
jgi:hypothetical protein